MRNRSAIAFLLIASPGTALADGGISALGGMLPVFIVLAIIGAAAGIWLLYTLVMIFTSPAKNTPLKRKIYAAYSYTLIAIIGFAAVIGSTFVSAIATLIGIALAVMLAIITSAVVARSARRAGQGD